MNAMREENLFVSFYNSAMTDLSKMKILIKKILWWFKLQRKCWGCGPTHIGNWCAKNPRP